LELRVYNTKRLYKNPIMYKASRIIGIRTASRHPKGTLLPFLYSSFNVEKPAITTMTRIIKVSINKYKEFKE
tara:strand:- start:16 stop:231 length:216 start_codon:yes stop_codon:yes gene_type:complete